MNDRIKKELNELKKEVYKHPEVEFRESGNCLIITRNPSECYGNAWEARIEWFKLRIDKRKYVGLRRCKKTGEDVLKVCYDPELSYSHVLSDNVENHIRGGMED